MVAPQIIPNSASPANQSQGIALGTEISVIFDREIDESSINAGTFVVSGPETDLITGPFLTLGDDPLRADDNDFLQSPAYQGIVRGTYRFERLNNAGSVSNIIDISGAGGLYRTRAIFTPDKPLSASVAYTVLIAGDEDVNDVVNTGIVTRTVFDTLKGPVLGTGDAKLTGGYLGTNQDTYNVQIVESGAIGTAKFLWWKNSQPALKFELTTSSTKQLLSDGVFVQFSTDGTSDIDDFIINGGSSADWSVVVKPGEPLAGNFLWTFTTGSGSIVTVPETTSTTIGLGDLTGTQITEGFRVVEIVPNLRDTNLDPLSLNTILVRFNKNIKVGQDLNALIKVFTDAVNGDPSIQATGNVAKTVSVNGDTLTITLN